MKRLIAVVILLTALVMCYTNVSTLNIQNTQKRTNTKMDGLTYNSGPPLTSFTSSTLPLPLAQDVQSGGLTINSDPNGYFSGGGTSTLGANTTWTDPTGQGLSQTQYNGLLDSYNSQLGNLQQSGTDWGNAYAPGYQNSVQKYLQQLNEGQGALNERGTQNEMALQQGRRSILDMVGQGIRSGGVMLAGRNATAGSAMEQLAKAYGQYGNKQLANVGNQYAQGANAIGIDQANFNAHIPLDVAGLKAKEQGDVMSKVQEARNNLASLQAWAANQSLPVQLDVAAQTQQIQDQINGMLQGSNAQLDTGAAGVKATSGDVLKQTAASRLQQGSSAINPFDFSSNVPIQFQNTGPAPGGLPIFTTPRKKTA